VSLSPAELRQLLRTELPGRARPRPVELRLPSARDVLYLILEGDSDENQALSLAVEAVHLVRSIDGRPMVLDEARKLVRDPAPAGALFAARNLLYETLSEQGSVFCLCPHCRDWEAELSVLALGLALRTTLWPIVEARLFLKPPALSRHLPAGSRPSGVAVCARLRYQAPSATLGLTPRLAAGPLGDVDAGREAAAWRRLDVDPADDHEDWSPDNPGFRTLLRLALALRADDDGLAEMVEILERLLVVDVFFLDNVYYLTHFVPVPEPPDEALLTCPRCGGAFLPVVADTGRRIVGC
jgi:hypothetical protein